jgi:hypothetical protein
MLLPCGLALGKEHPSPETLERRHRYSQLNFESIMKRWTEQGGVILMPRRRASAHTLALTAVFTLLVLFAGIDTIYPSYKHQFLLKADSQSQAGVVSPTYESFKWAQVCIAKSLWTLHLLRYACRSHKSVSEK